MNTAKKPNVLWLMTDQHHADCIGIAGKRNIKTPTLDKVAAKGTRFTHAYCNNPVCAPSRACFATGRYLHGHRLGSNAVQEYTGSLPETAGAHFRKHGYQTALIGKAHIPALWVREGFEHYALADMADADADDPRSMHYFKHLCDHGLGDTYDMQTRFAPQPGSAFEPFVSELPHEHTTEVWTGNEAVKFIEELRDPNRPFFLKVSFQRPHEPLSIAHDYERQYKAEDITLPDNIDDYFDNKFSGKPAYQRKYMSGPAGSGYPFRPKDKEQLREAVATYYELITIIDTQIGRVLDALEGAGELENTIIAFVSDHGDFAGDHGLMLKNLGIYESIHRIPFILAYPGGHEGKVDERIVESVDFFPSLCELACLPIPDSVQGCSILQLSEAGKPYAICEGDGGPGIGEDSGGTRLAIRTHEYRLVFTPGIPDDCELYNVLSDPDETENLWRNPEMTEVKLQLITQILIENNRYERAISPSEDIWRQSLNTPRDMFHKRGVSWRELEPLLDGKGH